MALTLNEFYNKYKNQPNVGNTPQNLGECVGLSSKWMDTFGIPHVYGHAYQLYNNAPDEYFAKIPNTPDAIVQNGDIVVWSQGYNGTYGHTGIAKGSADVNNFECFEQNDPLGSTPHIKKYNYAYVIGWLRIRNSEVIAQSIAKPEITDQTKIALLDNMEVQQVRSILSDLNRDNEQYKIINKEQATQIEQLRKEVKDCIDASKPSATPITGAKTARTPIGRLLLQLSDFFG